jgi:hypothetical protein
MVSSFISTDSYRTLFLPNAHQQKKKTFFEELSRMRRGVVYALAMAAFLVAGYTVCGIASCFDHDGNLTVSC